MLGLKEMAHRMATEQWDMKRDTKKYIHYIMCSAQCEELCSELDTLNLHELRMIQGCGVPGEAWEYCNALIKKRKQEVNALIAEQGRTAKMTVETNSFSEGGDIGESAVRPSES